MIGRAVVVALAVLAAPAAAGPRPTITLGRLTVDGAPRRIDRAELAIRVHRDDVVVDLAVIVTAPEAGDAGAGAFALSIPPGATATRLTLTTGEVTLRGRAMSPREARVAYLRATGELARDPALLERVRDGALRLRVSPLTATPTTITVRIRIPRDEAAGAIALRVDAPLAIQVDADSGAAAAVAIRGRAGTHEGDRIESTAPRGRAAITLAYGAVTGASWLTDTAVLEPVVSSTTSLVALPEPELEPSPTIPAEWRTLIASNRGRAPHPVRTLDAAAIRTAIRAQVPAITHCYQAAVQRDWNREGTVVLVIAIRGDGTIIEVRVDGADDADLSACMIAAFAGVTFPPFDDGGRVEIRYPFTLAVGAETRRARDAAAASAPPPLDQPPR